MFLSHSPLQEVLSLSLFCRGTERRSDLFKISQLLDDGASIEPRQPPLSPRSQPPAVLRNRGFLPLHLSHLDSGRGARSQGSAALQPSGSPESCPAAPPPLPPRFLGCFSKAPEVQSPPPEEICSPSQGEPRLPFLHTDAPQVV